MGSPTSLIHMPGGNKRKGDFSKLGRNCDWSFWGTWKVKSQWVSLRLLFLQSLDCDKVTPHPNSTLTPVSSDVLSLVPPFLFRPTAMCAARCSFFLIFY